MSAADNALAEREATASLTAAYFTGPVAEQTATFSEGRAQPQKPFALDTFLFDKHWLVCKNTEPGPFSSDTICRFDTEGRTYAHENAWTSAPASGGCAQCETWTVPIARATLSTITGITRVDKTHATVAYVFDVVPNVFGGEFGAWMSAHPSAWCGPDARATGGWGQTKTAQANFELTAGKWRIVEPSGTFDSLFADDAATKAAEHRCPETGT